MCVFAECNHPRTDIERVTHKGDPSYPFLTHHMSDLEDVANIVLFKHGLSCFRTQYSDAV